MNRIGWFGWRAVSGTGCCLVGSLFAWPIVIETTAGRERFRMACVVPRVSGLSCALCVAAEVHPTGGWAVLVQVLRVVRAVLISTLRCQVAP